jgi:esterase/lipase superfamily enzyme
VVGALKEMALIAGPAGLSKKFRHVVLTAPDIDRDVFLNLAAELPRAAERVTLYISSNDVALAAAGKLCNCVRLGQTPVFFNQIDTIDASLVDTSLLHHSFYGDNTSVLTDIRRLLDRGTGVSQRTQPPLLPNERPYKLVERKVENGLYYQFIP